MVGILAAAIYNPMQAVHIQYAAFKHCDIYLQKYAAVPPS
jgi:hypothetical protein